MNEAQQLGVGSEAGVLSAGERGLVLDVTGGHSEYVWRGYEASYV